MSSLRNAIVDALPGRFRQALTWPTNSDKFRLLGGILLVLFAVYAAIFLIVTARREIAQPSGDFFALWSAARFVAAYPAAQVYDAATLHNAQVALGLDPRADYPFPYPPFFLLLLEPVAKLPYLAAYAVLLGGTLVLYVWATIGTAWRSASMAAALLAPTTTITLAAGQLGLLAAALLIGGMRLAGRRPVAAGILFGLATYKPQIGLLVPVALVAARLWRCIAAATITIVALGVAAMAAYGTAVWPAWFSGLFAYADEFASAHDRVGHLMPTVSACLAHLGVAPAMAAGAQLAAGLIAAGIIWRCYRDGPGPLAAAALFVATFLATPHAFVYDLPPVTTAVLWTIGERQRAGAALASSEVLAMMLALVAPIGLVAGGSGSFFVVLSLVLLLAPIVRRCLWIEPTARSGCRAESP
jgi:hypothetical protein